MIYALTLFLGTDPALVSLGSDKYAVRVAAEHTLRSSWRGWATAAANREHPDPEVAARCRRIVGESQYPAWRRAVCLTVCTVWVNSDDGGALSADLPVIVEHWLDGWLKYNWLAGGQDSVSYWRNFLWGNPYDGND